MSIIGLLVSSPNHASAPPHKKREIKITKQFKNSYAQIIYIIDGNTTEKEIFDKFQEGKGIKRIYHSHDLKYDLIDFSSVRLPLLMKINKSFVILYLVRNDDIWLVDCGEHDPVYKVRGPQLTDKMRKASTDAEREKIEFIEP